MMQLSVEKGLVARLVASAAGQSVGGQVIKNQAKSTTPYPYILFSLNTSADRNLTARRMGDFRYLIKAVSEDDGSTNGAALALLIAEQIDTALHEQTFSVDAPWKVYRVQRLSLVDYTMQDERVQHHHRGGIYRIRVSEEF